MLKPNSFSKIVKYSGTLHHKDILFPNKNNEVSGIKIASHKTVFINYNILIESQNE